MAGVWVWERDGAGNEGSEECTYGVAGMVGDRGGGGCRFAFVAREHLFWAARYHVYAVSCVRGIMCTRYHVCAVSGGLFIRFR